FSILLPSSQSPIRNPQSPIPNPQSAIRNSQSAIPNPQSAIRNSQSAISLSFFTALIFVTHPLQTQAVTYIAQRYTSMAAMFYIASVLFYILGRRLQRYIFAGEMDIDQGRQSAKSYLAWIFFGLTGLCALLAFLSKQNTVSLPGAILLVEYILFDKTWEGWKKKLKWLVPICIACVLFITYVVLLKGNLDFGNLLEDVSSKTRDISSITRWEYLCTQFNVLVIYIRLLFLPLGQNFDYLYPFKDGFFDGLTPLAFIFLLSLLAIGIWQRKKRPIVLFSILWFFITLSVESGIVPIRDALFEHRLYLAMPGLAIFVSYIIFRLLGKKRVVVTSLSCLAILSLGMTSYLRNNVWQSNLTLWQDVVSKSPHNQRAHYNLGNAWKRNNKLDKAISEYLRAIRLKPQYAKAHLNLGIVYHKKGQYKKAKQHFQSALKTRPKYLQARVNLALSLMKLGRLQEALRHLQRALKEDPDNIDALYNYAVITEQQGQKGQAVKFYKKVLKNKADHTDARYNLANLLAKTGEVRKAVNHYEKVLSYRSKDYKTHYNLGNALFQLKRIGKAKRHYEQALKINPDFALPHYSLGTIYFRTNEFKEATKHFQSLKKIRPDFEQADFFLGIMKAQKGELGQAKTYLKKALNINPGYVAAHVNLGLVLARLGQFRQAQRHFLTALQIDPNNVRARKYLRKLNQKIQEER
ncbi:MAG TPA: tetratricopeptide repeat protein, partial [Desulfohalobiaceae bacterium]|nr:tetratricopeptide repeat protein [Desulfohalobiaceae bacterium]